LNEIGAVRNRVSRAVEAFPDVGPGGHRCMAFAQVAQVFGTLNPSVLA
jgi:hypothetical protein